jgi:hypothetical protein
MFGGGKKPSRAGRRIAGKATINKPTRRGTTNPKRRSFSLNLSITIRRVYKFNAYDENAI